MEITEAGKAMVASMEFAEQTRDFITEWKQAGFSDDKGQRVVIAMIAVTLCASDGLAIPFNCLTEEPFRELISFIDSHVDEINEVSETLFANILLLDCSEGPVQ